MRKLYKVLCIKDVGGFDFEKDVYYDCYETDKSNHSHRYPTAMKYTTIKCVGYSLGTPDTEDGRKFLKEHFKPISEVRKEKLKKLNYIAGI